MNTKVKSATDEEWFDVVDERDEIVGRELRPIVHAKGLRHRAVHILVFNAVGELFLQKRSLTKDSSPGLWTLSCSGHVDAGEDYDTAAMRELSEELSCVPSALPKRLRRVDAREETGWEFCWVYRLQAEGPFVLQPEEIDDGKWMPLAQLERDLKSQPEVYCPHFRWLWPQLALD